MKKCLGLMLLLVPELLASGGVPPKSKQSESTRNYESLEKAQSIDEFKYMVSQKFGANFDDMPEAKKNEVVNELSAKRILNLIIYRGENNLSTDDNIRLFAFLFAHGSKIRDHETLQHASNWTLRAIVRAKPEGALKKAEELIREQEERETRSLARSGIKRSQNHPPATQTSITAHHQTPSQPSKVGLSSATQNSSKRHQQVVDVTQAEPNASHGTTTRVQEQTRLVDTNPPQELIAAEADPGVGQRQLAQAPRQPTPDQPNQVGQSLETNQHIAQALEPVADAGQSDPNASESSTTRADQQSLSIGENPPQEQPEMQADPNQQLLPEPQADQNLEQKPPLAGNETSIQPQRTVIENSGQTDDKPKKSWSPGLNIKTAAIVALLGIGAYYGGPIVFTKFQEYRKGKPTAEPRTIKNR